MNEEEYVKEHYHVSEHNRSNKLRHIKRFNDIKEASAYADLIAPKVLYPCGYIHRQRRVFVVNCQGLGKKEHFIDKWYVSKCKE